MAIGWRSSLYGLAAGITGLALTVSCSSAPPPEPIAVIPGDAQIVASVDIARLRSDSDVAEVLTSMSQSGEETLTNESLLAMFEEQTGLDLGNFSDLLLFGDLTPENGLSLVGRGEMDIDQLFEQLQEEASGSLTESKYRDARLIEGTKAGGEFALGVISGELVILGMSHQVRAAIDVSAGEREGLSADLLDAYDSLGAPLVKGVIAIEPEDVANLIGGGGLFGDLGFLDALGWAGFAFDEDAAAGSISVVLGFADAESAEEAKDFMDALVGLAAQLGGAEDVGSLTEAIDIAQQESNVVVTVSLTAEELRSVLDAATGLDLAPLIPTF